ncbi:MAG: glycosyltransferase [Verrucomicrobia bacterium]|nr:glycosyltransferase [Verrucomicrobiota bacterium]
MLPSSLKTQAKPQILPETVEVSDLRLPACPKVSIFMVTYNHENFIAQAIDSVLMQQTNFDYELVIGEDCSTDNTRQIVVDYQKKYPSKIRLLLHKKNLGEGGRENSRRTYVSCRGDYIALLEGDDYWTDPQKLQTQADFLDAHPESSLCFHDAMVHFEDSSSAPHRFLPPELRCDRTTEGLLNRYMIATLATVVRAKCIPNLDKWPAGLELSDWAIALKCSEQGRISYIDKIMGVYRRHEGGTWGGVAQENRYRRQIELLQGFNKYFSYRYDDICRRAMVDRIIPLMECYATDGDVANAARYALMCLRLDPLGRHASWSKLGRLAVRACIPALHRGLTARLPWSIRLYRNIKSKCANRTTLAGGR